MARPRSDIGRLQYQDIIFTFQDAENSILSGVIIHFREPKETQVKTTRLGILQDVRTCPVSTLHLFVVKSEALRSNLPENHTLFLAYIENPEKVTSIRPTTLSNWLKEIMKKAGIDIEIYTAHSIRAASSTKAVEKGHSIQEVKEHANWSLSSNTFEKFYYKPTNQASSSTAISHSIFSSTENPITLGDGVEPTKIDLGTTNNPYVGETKSPNVIDTQPWYRRL